MTEFLKFILKFFLLEFTSQFKNIKCWLNKIPILLPSEIILYLYIISVYIEQSSIFFLTFLVFKMVLKDVQYFKLRFPY